MASMVSQIKMNSNVFDVIEDAVRKLRSEVDNARFSYDNMVHRVDTMTLENSTLTSVADTANAQVQQMKLEVAHLHSKIQDLKDDIKKVQSEKESIHLEKLELLKVIADLERENNRMVEENKSFLKVSQIIMYEKENTRLKKELEQLKAQVSGSCRINGRAYQDSLDITHAQTEADVRDVIPEVKGEDLKITQCNTEVAKPYVVCDIEEDIDDLGTTHQEGKVIEVDEPCNQDENEEDRGNDEEGMNVYEVTIKGTEYYVSDDDNMLIYKKLEDGEIGEQVGYYQKQKTGKNKVVWL